MRIKYSTQLIVRASFAVSYHQSFSQGFSKVPDQVSWIRQTSPVAEHLDLIFEQLQEVKLNLADSAEAFHEGLMSEAKTQEEIMKVTQSAKKDRDIYVDSWSKNYLMTSM